MNISEAPDLDDSSLTCRTYIIENEGHTLGNALTKIIMGYDDVLFCAYTVPHPAEQRINVRIVADKTPALEILKRGFKDLSKLCDHVRKTFEEKCNNMKYV